MKSEASCLWLISSIFLSPPCPCYNKYKLALRCIQTSDQGANSEEMKMGLEQSDKRSKRSKRSELISSDGIG
eukprot:scaffold6728_cov68-Skeletonema_marinoi.AAC.1